MVKHQLYVILTKEAVAKSIKALNHKDTKAQRKPFLSAGRRGPEKTLCLRNGMVRPT